MSSISLKEIQSEIQKLVSVHHRLERIYIQLENRPYSSRMQIQFKIEMKRSFQSIEAIIRKCKLSDAIRSPGGATAITNFKNQCLEIESLWRRGIRLACQSYENLPPASAVQVLTEPPEEADDNQMPPVLLHRTSAKFVDAIFLSSRPRDELRKQIVRINGNLQYLVDVAENEIVDENTDPTDTEESSRPGLDPVVLDNLSPEHGPTPLGTALRATGFAVLGGAVGMLIGGPPLALMVGAKAGAIGATSVGVVGVLSGAGVGVGVPGHGQSREVETLTSTPLPSAPPPPPPPRSPRRRRESDDDEEDSNEDKPLLELTEPSVWDARPNSFF